MTTHESCNPRVLCMTCGWLDRLKSRLLVASLVTVSFPTVVHCISNLEDLVDLVRLKFSRHVVFVYFQVLMSFLVLPSENVPVRGKGLQTVGTCTLRGWGDRWCPYLLQSLSTLFLRQGRSPNQNLSYLARLVTSEFQGSSYLHPPCHLPPPPSLGL